MTNATAALTINVRLNEFFALIDRFAPPRLTPTRLGYGATTSEAHDATTLVQRMIDILPAVE